MKTHHLPPLPHGDQVDIDDFLALIDSLPKVQQAIVHAHIEAKFKEQIPAKQSLPIQRGHD